MFFLLGLFFLISTAFFAEGASSESIPYSMIIAQVYNVVLFVALAVILLKSRARSFFKKRNFQFINEICRVQRTKEEALNQKKEMKSKILELEKNWENSFQKVQSEAEERKVKLLNQARKQAQYIEEESLKTVVLAQKKLGVLLRRELFDEAFEEARKKIPGKIDKRKKREFFMEFLEGLKS